LYADVHLKYNGCEGNVEVRIARRIRNQIKTPVRAPLLCLRESISHQTKQLLHEHPRR